MVRRIKETAHRWAVSENEVPARELVEITADDHTWKVIAEDQPFTVHARVKGALVKLTPPHTATDAHVDRLRGIMEEAGAVAIRIMPRPKTMVLPSEVTIETKAPAHRSVREVVMTLLAEANTKDRPRLTGIVEEAMSKAGL